MGDLVNRMNELREEMLRRRVPRDLQHECVEYLIASYQELPSLKHRVSHPSYDDEMKAKCMQAYKKTLQYLDDKQPKPI